MTYTRTYPRNISFPCSVQGPSSGVPVFVQSQDIGGSRSGSAVSGWRKIIKDGGDATSDMTSERYVIEKMTPGSAVHVLSWTNPLAGDDEVQTASGFVRPNSRVPSGHLADNLSTVDGKALSLLYGKIRQESSHMNGLLFLGELREALAMIRRPANSLVEGIRRYDSLLHKRKRGIPKRTSLDKRVDIWKDIVAGTWLEVSFGWRPLVSDSQAIAETVARYTRPDVGRTRVRSYFEEPLGASSGSVSDTWGNSDRIGATSGIGVITTGGVQYICGLVADGNGPTHALGRFTKLSGLTLENFVPTLYELLPYSFLIDYFSNLGDIVEAVCTNTTRVSWKMKTTRLRTTMQVNSQAKSILPFSTHYGTKSFASSGAGFSQIVKSSVTRMRLTELPVPDLVFTIPGRASQYGNMAALLAKSRGSRFGSDVTYTPARGGIL